MPDWLARRGLISAEQLVYARRVQAKLVSARPLVEIFKELRLLSSANLSAALKEDPPGMRLATCWSNSATFVLQSSKPPWPCSRRAVRGASSATSVEHGFIDEPQLVEILASQLGFPFVVPHYQRIDRERLRQMPPKLFSRNSFLPVEKLAGKIVVAFADPLDREDCEAAERIFGRQLLPAIAPRQALREAAELHRRGIQMAG